MAGDSKRTIGRKNGSRLAFDEARSDPERLAKLITAALEEGAADELLAPSEQLFRIDPDATRRYATRAVVLARNHRFREAEQLLERSVALYGHSPEIHVARAAVAREGNLLAKEGEALWAALTLDPNHEIAFSAWCALHAASEEQYRKSIEKTAQLDGAWRAKIELLRLAGGGDGSLLADALSDSSGHPEAMRSLSAVLAAAGSLEGLVETIVPRYTPSLDGAACGVNLLHALLSRGEIDRGLELLERIRPQAGDDLALHLRFYDAALRAAEQSEDEAKLLQVIAAVARHDTAANRVHYYRAIARGRFLLGIRSAIVPASGEPNSGVTPATAVAPNGDDVLLAFTSAARLAEWDQSRRGLPVTPRELLERAAANEATIVLNAAGPASMHIGSEEVSAMLAGEVPATPQVHDDTSFVVEPLRRGLAPAMKEAVLERLVHQGADFNSVHLVRLVDEKRGVNLGVAISFPEGQKYNATSSILGELNDRTGGLTELRKVRFFVPQSVRFSERIAEIGERVELSGTHALKLDLE